MCCAIGTMLHWTSWIAQPDIDPGSTLLTATSLASTTTVLVTIEPSSRGQDTVLDCHPLITAELTTEYTAHLCGSAGDLCICGNMQIL